MRDKIVTIDKNRKREGIINDSTIWFELAEKEKLSCTKISIFCSQALNTTAIYSFQMLPLTILK